MLKFATATTCILQSQFYKQTDGSTMVVLFISLNLKKIKSLKPKFYRRFVDNVISRQLKNMHDSLFENLNNHEKIKFTTETNPKKFLATWHLLENDIIKPEVSHKANKLQTPKKIQKKCDKNRHAWRMSSILSWEKQN